MTDSFYEGYLKCALWSSTDEHGTSLDEIENDLADVAVGKLEADCIDSQHDYAALLERAYALTDDSGNIYTATRAGHDFWLTRNGPGAGFWDRGLGEVGDLLSAAAHSCGTCELYVGDDGRIYA